jgi:predicted nuclease of predicted toxin-antitoxin system
MIAIAVDENFDHHILRALLRRVPALDARTVHSAGLAEASDSAVLKWAADEGRVLITHDVHTLVGFAYERVARADPMPGVIVVQTQAPRGEALEHLELIVRCAKSEDLRDQVFYVPMR